MTESSVERRAQYLLPGCILLLYFLLPTRTYYWDGVLFSLVIENVHQGRVPAVALFHPNHLIYNAAGYGVYSAALTMWPSIRALTVLQISNAVASILAGYILFLLAKRLSNAPWLPILCWLLFAFGATWWKFSTDADSYVVSVLLLLCCALWLLRPKPRIFPAALCHATAMLFHELAIFTYVPVLAFILIGERRRISEKLALAVSYCAGTGGIVAIAYLLCYRAVDHRAYPTLASWIASYASDASFTHSISDVGRYFGSYLKLFGGGKLPLIREFFGFPECAALVIAAALLVAAIRLLKRPRIAEGAQVHRRALMFWWTWLIAFAIFLGVWDPTSAFHKLFVWPAIVLLLGGYLESSRYCRERIRAFIAFAATLGAWNFAAFIYPHSHAAADPVLMLAQKIHRELPYDATVFYRVLDPDDWYLEYFAPGREWRNLPPDWNVKALFASTSGPVCLETTALEGFRGAVDTTRKWDLVSGSHNVRLECLRRPQ
jgi:hypothetical protein